MHERSARAWCTGKTQRDRVEREVGGGIGMGNTCKSKLYLNDASIIFFNLEFLDISGIIQ